MLGLMLAWNNNSDSVLVESNKQVILAWLTPPSNEAERRKMNT